MNSKHNEKSEQAGGERRMNSEVLGCPGPDLVFFQREAEGSVGGVLSPRQFLLPHYSSNERHLLQTIYYTTRLPPSLFSLSHRTSLRCSTDYFINRRPTNPPNIRCIYLSSYPSLETINPYFYNTMSLKSPPAYQPTYL